jgi:acetolactate synthase-1/2/3 large subunit
MATSGPGATNLVTPLADAHMDSVPIVAITGQVGASSIGTDAFQEADIRGITMPVTKHNFLVTDPDEIPRTVAEAFHIAATGRPGPVLVDVAKSALQATTTYRWPAEINLPGYRPVTRPHAKQIKEAARLILDAKRPVLYVGGGTIRAGASRELVELADLTGIPVVTTLMARGALPDSHPQHLGMPGMHGSVAAVAGLQRSDLIISLGARFDDRVTGNLDSFAPGAQVIHADIDPAEIGKNRTTDVPIVGDCREVIADLTTLLRTEAAAGSTGDYGQWAEYLAGIKKRYPVAYDKPADGSLAPQYVLERLSAIAGPGAVYCAGVGQHQMWAAHYIDFEHPRTWINSGGLGTMGYAVPAAMGAKVGRPEATVWAVDGDGCFQMTNQELATCAINDIPIKVAIINNESLGMVRQWQTLFYNERYSNTDLQVVPRGTPGAKPAGVRIPDFVKLADAYGCEGLACESPDDVDATIEKAMAIDDRPVVVDFRVHRDAMVWPMVAAGTSNDDIKYARDLAPQFDVDEL